MNISFSKTKWKIPNSIQLPQNKTNNIIQPTNQNTLNNQTTTPCKKCGNNI